MGPRSRAIIAATPMLAVKATCPTRGAPPGFGDGQRHVLCRYCNTSLRIEAPPAGHPAAPTRLARDAVSPQDVDRILQLVFEGKRGEAIQHYAQVAGLSLAE